MYLPLLWSGRLYSSIANEGLRGEGNLSFEALESSAKRDEATAFGGCEVTSAASEAV